MMELEVKSFIKALKIAKRTAKNSYPGLVATQSVRLDSLNGGLVVSCLDYTSFVDVKIPANGILTSVVVSTKDLDKILSVNPKGTVLLKNVSHGLEIEIDHHTFYLENQLAADDFPLPCDDDPVLTMTSTRDGARLRSTLEYLLLAVSKDAVGSLSSIYLDKGRSVATNGKVFHAVKEELALLGPVQLHWTSAETLVSAFKLFPTRAVSVTWKRWENHPVEGLFCWDGPDNVQVEVTTRIDSLGADSQYPNYENIVSDQSERFQYLVPRAPLRKILTTINKIEGKNAAVYLRAEGGVLEIKSQVSKFTEKVSGITEGPAATSVLTYCGQLLNALSGFETDSVSIQLYSGEPLVITAPKERFLEGTCAILAEVHER